MLLRAFTQTHFVCVAFLWLFYSFATSLPFEFASTKFGALENFPHEFSLFESKVELNKFKVKFSPKVAWFARLKF